MDSGEVREVDDTVPIHCACDEADVYAVQDPAYMRMRDRPAGRSGGIVPENEDLARPYGKWVETFTGGG